MAAKTKPKDVRSLMKEQRNKSKKKIDSPLARYNNGGQLFCILCNTIIKSDLLWDAHVRGIKHKENLVSLKSGQQKTLTGSTRCHFPQQDKSLNNYNSSKVNTVASTSSRSNKRRTEENHTSDLRSEAPVIKKPKVSCGNVSSSIPVDFFDEDTSSSVNEQKLSVGNDVEMTSTSAGPSEMAISGLPADFFDSSQTESEETENENSTKEKESAQETEEAIPEGFFDDPKLDAKARKVQYKDPADEEWEKFQKALSAENQVSEAIIHEAEEESRIDRALDEISEQRLYYIRADVLRDKQNAFKKAREKKNERHNVEMEEDSDTDSDDIEDMFNWRAKKA